MSSEFQSALGLLLLNNYASLVVVTAVVYDYVLTFSREVEYIWCKPWSWVSTIFLLVRYVGLCWIMASAFICTSFVSGPLEVSNMVFLVSFWTFAVFLSAADLVMILRVWAIWNRSRIIISMLLFIHVLQTITTVVFVGIYNNPDTYFSVTNVRLLDFSFCDATFVNTPPIRHAYLVAPRLVLGATLLVLTVLQTLKQSFRMYKATNQWQPNRYVRQLVRDGILYFLVNTLYQIACVLNQGGTPPNNTRTLVLDAFIYTSFYLLAPRFIISIRELFDRDLRGRREGIDTGFGLLSQSTTGPNMTVSVMVFGDADPICQDPGVEDESDEISLEIAQDDMGWQA